jgi:tetratricopeptide (TPR) repeat protein
VLRGVVALFQKDYEGAATFFEAAHLQSPSAFAASNNLALALCELKDEAKLRRALEYATTNARQYPKETEAASTYGWVLYKAGQIDAAEQALRQAASSGNISSDTAYYLAQVSVDRKRIDDAKQLLKAALNNQRPFSKRQEAQALLDKIGK